MKPRKEAKALIGRARYLERKISRQIKTLEGKRKSLRLYRLTAQTCRHGGCAYCTRILRVAIEAVK